MNEQRDITKIKQRDVILSVQSVSKQYRLYDKPEDRLKDILLSRFGKQYGREFNALNQITFDVHRGETFGIIGRNGSGKSTLLQIIAGIIKPTSGILQVNGKVAALLELGSGFNPEFTGRENVFMNGAILGISRNAMEERLQEILEFADIGKFVDQPVKFYSSGMFVRLAFAVATSINADILLVDEALAVGDVFFRQKCYKRLEKLKNLGTAIILVSHAMNEVQEFCDRAIVLNYGQQIYSGDTCDAVARYYMLEQQDNCSKEIAVVDCNEIKMGEAAPKACCCESVDGLFWIKDEVFMNTKPSDQLLYGEFAYCSGLVVCNSDGEVRRDFEQGENAVFYYEFQLLREIQIPVVGLVIQNDKNVIVHGKTTIQDDVPMPASLPVGIKLRVKQTVQLDIACGEYTFYFGLNMISREFYEKRTSLSSEEIDVCQKKLCSVPRAGSIIVLPPRKMQHVGRGYYGMCNLQGAFEVNTFST